LAKDPARRPQSFAEIAQKLEIASPKTVRAKQAVEAKATAGGLLAPVMALKSNRTALIAAGAAVLLIGVVGVWFFGFRKTAVTAAVQAPPAAVAKTEDQGANALGGVIVNTSPSRATVALGGMDAGKSPITFKGIHAGRYPLRISLDGYTPVEREVEVKAGQFVDLGTITLQRATGMAGGTRQITEPPKVTTERKEESRPEPPANAGELAVPLNDFSGG
jgi:hypothetical protein